MKKVVDLELMQQEALAGLWSRQFVVIEEDTIENWWINQTRSLSFVRSWLWSEHGALVRERRQHEAL